MNRTFLIFLMIGTALMIAVIGGERGSRPPGYMPWEVKVLNNGNIRVFGITLHKTRIQEANQILSSFPQTRLQSDPQGGTGLYAVYDQLNMGGFVARLELQYDLDEETLNSLQAKARPAADGNYSTLPGELELELLDTPIKAINYLPLVDYSIDEILQRFGQATEHHNITDNQQLWQYPDMGLNILIDSQGQDRFSYHAIIKSATPIAEQIDG